jgi:hypothetical protein
MFALPAFSTPTLRMKSTLFTPPTNNSKVKETPSPTPLQRQGATVVNPEVLFKAMGVRVDDFGEKTPQEWHLLAKKYMKRRRTRGVAPKWKLIETLLDPSKHRNLKLCFEPANDISVSIVGRDPEQLLTIIKANGLEGFLDQRKPLSLDRFDFNSLTLNNMRDHADADDPILWIKNTRKFRNLFHPSIFSQVLDILQEFADTQLTPLLEPKPPNPDQLSLFFA